MPWVPRRKTNANIAAPGNKEASQPEAVSTVIPSLRTYSDGVRLLHQLNFLGFRIILHLADLAACIPGLLVQVVQILLAPGRFEERLLTEGWSGGSARL